MRQVFGALAVLAIGWGLCAPAHAQNELFPLQAISGGGGGGGCTGGDSPYVPAGYHCVPGSSDEFNGASVDTSKWIISGSPGGQGSGTGIVSDPTDGFVSEVMAQVSSDPNVDFNGSTSMGMVSKFPIPDAPMYLEFRRRVNSIAVLMQFWTNNCSPDNDCVGEETDIDLGPFNGCNQSNTDPGADIYGLCSGMFKHSNDGQPQALNISLDGGRVFDDSVFHIIMMQRLPDPAPNGTVRYGVDGTWLKTVTNMPDSRWAFPSLNRSGSNTDIDHFISNLFCSNGNGCPYTASIDWDYLRVYTPSGLPNGY
jgi:hypothetical protein